MEHKPKPSIRISPSSRRLETLKGVFMPEKTQHGRNFVRENKQQVRDLPLIKPNQYLLRQRTEEEKLRQQSQVHKNMQQKYIKRHVGAVQQQQLKQQDYGAAGDAVKILKHCPSCVSVVSRNQEVQTDIIRDEHFLQNALEQCVSIREMENNHVPAYEQDQTSIASVPYSQYGTGNGKNDYNELEDNFEKLSINNNQERYSVKGEPKPDKVDDDWRSIRKQQEAGTLDLFTRYEPKSNAEKSTQLPDVISTKSLDCAIRHDDRMNLDCDDAASIAASVATVSVRSRRLNDGIGVGRDPSKDRRSTASVISPRSYISAVSKATNKSYQNVALDRKLGSKEDVNLPRYLEREKRAKEEERNQESMRDPDCPEGHKVLPEKERLEIYNGLKKRYREKVEELNRMPITKDTMQIRARKKELESLLEDIEKRMSLFSHPRVYIKCN